MQLFNIVNVKSSFFFDVFPKILSSSPSHTRPFYKSLNRDDIWFQSLPPENFLEAFKAPLLVPYTSPFPFLTPPLICPLPPLPLIYQNLTPPLPVPYFYTIELNLLEICLV